MEISVRIGWFVFIYWLSDIQRNRLGTVSSFCYIYVSVIDSLVWCFLKLGQWLHFVIFNLFYLAKCQSGYDLLQRVFFIIMCEFCEFTQRRRKEVFWQFSYVSFFHSIRIKLISNNRLILHSEKEKDILFPVHLCMEVIQEEF